ncbi:MAG: DnaJ domain-containing protein [Sphingomonadaceae bacterium]|nr:DnaJ domain-containing protein [Sphingomonadaceae bacterium]
MIKFLILVGLAIVAYLYFTGQLTKKRSGLSLDEARAVLGVTATADIEEVRAAHRRIVSQVHPDKGGTAELTARVNAARDVLLKALGPKADGEA